MKQIGEVMTRGVRALAPDDSLRLAAQAMDELAVGALPVCDGQRLVGMVTDRDLVVRGLARGLPADETPLGDVMTREPRWCEEAQSIDEAAKMMREARIRRLPVVDREHRLVGMVSLGDLAAKGGAEQAGEALESISQPAQPDRSGLSAASSGAGGGADVASRNPP